MIHHDKMPARFQRIKQPLVHLRAVDGHIGDIVPVFDGSLIDYYAWLRSDSINGAPLIVH
jgi:hypothetical protein